MTDLLVLDLVEKGLVTDQIVLTVGYDTENIKNGYEGAVETDHYGRQAPKRAHGSVNLGEYTSSTKLVTEKATELYERITDRNLTVRRMYIVANHVVAESAAPVKNRHEQLSLFEDPAETEKTEAAEKAAREKERRIQQAAIELKKKFDKNAILKGINLQEGATTVERNRQVGGHKGGD